MIAHAPVKGIAFSLTGLPDGQKLLKGRIYGLQFFSKVKAELSLLGPVFNNDSIAEGLLRSPKLGQLPLSRQTGPKKYATGYRREDQGKKEGEGLVGQGLVRI
jgi:hypothetical protein